MDLIDLLRIATSAVSASTSSPHSQHFWSDPAYRASANRAFQGRSGAMTIEDKGMAALESGMDSLLRDQRVTTKWSKPDLWGLVLALLDAASQETVDLDAAVKRIRNPKPTLHLAALANVTWSAPPATFGTLTIADLRSPSDIGALATVLDLEERPRDAFVAHAQTLLDQIGGYVVASVKSPKQGELAYADLERTIDDLFGLALLLSNDLADHGVFPLRGPTNKPGLRGIALDRAALEDLLRETGSAELAAHVLELSDWGANSQYRWHSADPMPLNLILDAGSHTKIRDLLNADDPIAQRVKVAARWYARAFWANAEDDSALAVSIALDSMLTGRDALPGAVSKSRYAFLERNVHARPVKLDRYEAVYSVRSAIAHGGDATRRLTELGGATSLLQDARWVAEQLLDLRAMSKPGNDKEFRDLWAAIQWGTLAWAEFTEEPRSIG